MDYYSFGSALIEKNPEARTLCGDLEGRRIWIKQPVPPKTRIWHLIQKAVSCIIKNPILRVTVSQGGSRVLRAEAERLRKFRQMGFHVPEVLAVHDDMIIMTDIGPQFRQFLDQTKDFEGRLALLKICMQSMASLHNAGLAHGRPYMRDMTWDGERIGFLDLEEDPVTVMPLATAQARDVWIFLSAASRYALKSGSKTVYEDRLIIELYNEYAQSANKQALDELRSLVKFMRPLRLLLDNRLLWPKIGRDARQSAFVNRCLEYRLGVACSS